MEHCALSPVISELGSEQNQTTWGPENEQASKELIAAPNPADDALAATLDPVVSLQGLLPLDPPTMSANVTMVTPHVPLNGGLRGRQSMIFDGTCS